MFIDDNELGQILLNEKIVDKNKLEDIRLFALSSEQSLIEALLEKDIISDESLGKLIAKNAQIPFVVLSLLEIKPDHLKILPENVAKLQKAIIFDRNSSDVKVAMTDPSNQLLIKNISLKTSLSVTPYYATQRDIENALRLYRPDVQQTFNQLVSLGPESSVLALENIPVAKIADLIIEYAYQDKASDIHIEPDEKYCLIRFRLDGVLHDILRLPKNLHDRIVTRIKVLAKIRTDEHLGPQDGKMRLNLERENLDIRVSIIPVTEGEKVVLRLLSTKSMQYSLLDLGMSQTDLEKIHQALRKPYGMILSTGPTGSGKTTSIYSMLKILNTRGKNITTIEDPVEYHISGVNQIQVNTRTDLSFATGLRSILRQDPNIIFVGEIRDNDTAGIAVNAALTGHLVLSTLHTNDAATALPRFLDMKVEPFLVASTVNIVIGQRLVRQICRKCKQSYSLNSAELLKNITPNIYKKHFGTNKKITLYRGVGCHSCHQTGYSGRIGIFEVMAITPAIRRLISSRSDSSLISAQAIKDGMTTMLDDGLSKCLSGQTSLENIISVTKLDTI
jgi:type IV pilus assembly protein PilB